ncbi:MAG: hypothetical protein KAT40_01250 [Bacteroidales bacterium]|nr:hypothetical protein [Bacteroidales bacterium]
MSLHNNQIAEDSFNSLDCFAIDLNGTMSDEEFWLLVIPNFSKSLI